MGSIKNYLIGSLAFIIVALVLALANADIRRAVADELKDVRVINTEAMPAKVRDVDNPARQPVHAEANCSDDEGSACETVIFAVPAGKRLVIEYASMGARVSDVQVSRMGIRTTVGGQEILHRLPPTPPAPAVNSSTSTGEQLRLYADPGTSVSVVGAGTDSNGTGDFFFTISGHLVDVQ